MPPTDAPTAPTAAAAVVPCAARSALVSRTHAPVVIILVSMMVLVPCRTTKHAAAAAWDGSPASRAVGAAVLGPWGLRLLVARQGT